MESRRKEDENLIRRLLRYDLEKFCEVLGKSKQITPLADQEAAALLNLAERYSTSTDDEKRLRCLIICGLLWEHRSIGWHALPGFTMNLLSRLGLGPSMPMVDEHYNSKDGRLAPIGSSYIEAAITARSIKREITIGTKLTMLFSDFQYRVWKAIDENPRLGISAPTSAGKSHVLVYKVIDILRKSPGIGIFIVPTLSLIQQVSRDVKVAARRVGLSNFEVYQTYTSRAPMGNERLVYVLTQERALSALRQDNALQNPRILIIDEIQNIERLGNEDDDRSRTLYDVIQQFSITRNPDRIIVTVR